MLFFYVLNGNDFHSSTTAKKIYYIRQRPKICVPPRFARAHYLITHHAVVIYPGMAFHRDEKRGTEIDNSSTRISVDASDTISDFW